MDKQVASSANRMHHISAAPAAILAPPPADSQSSGDAALLLLDRLRSTVIELFKTLSETLPDDRAGTAEGLRRAGAMLAAVGGQVVADVPPPERQGLAPWQVRRVLAHIDANLDKSIRNKDLADIARRSEFHFNVAFRLSVGDSPHEYIIRRRMERAQGLMLSTDAPLSQIASECGLADQAHFTRLFRRVVGETPAAWRRARAAGPLLRA
jgi:AraC family transcriptional regulator